MDGQTEADGLGAPSVWGITPAIDLFDALYVRGEASEPLFPSNASGKSSESKADASTSPDTTPGQETNSSNEKLTSSANVLLWNCGDVRHILRTYSQLRRWQPHSKLLSGTPVVNFYVVEPAAEVLARYILLFMVFIDDDLTIEVSTLPLSRS